MSVLYWVRKSLNGPKRRSAGPGRGFDASSKGYGDKDEMGRVWLDTERSEATFQRSSEEFRGAPRDLMREIHLTDLS